VFSYNLFQGHPVAPKLLSFMPSGVRLLPCYLNSLARLLLLSTTLALSCLLAVAPESLAKHSHSTTSLHHSTKHGHSSETTAHSKGKHRKSGRSGRASHGRELAHHGRHHHVVASHESKGRHAYPVGIFIKSPPAFDSSPLPEDSAREVISAFNRGTADSYPARTLVRAGIAKYHPLRGGIYWRREPVKYIVMHSTETGIPISATHVIEGWSSMGMRHPGAQYVVDRDGTIYQAVDPDLATVHVNIFKTLPGINNDNSIGIEMNHTGAQDYPVAQRDSVIKLVGYLKHRYNIEEGNIITHRYAQQGDHTDPVNFNWDDFLATVNTFHNQAIAYRTSHIKDDSRSWQREPEPKANTYLKPHKEIGGPTPGEASRTSVEDADMSSSSSSPNPAPSSSSSQTPAPAAAPKPIDNRDPSGMPPESRVPEPSEADITSPKGTAGNAAKDGGTNKGAPIEMKVYPAPGQAPLPGGSPSQSPP
jgi:hypothetical protein